MHSPDIPSWTTAPWIALSAQSPVPAVSVILGLLFLGAAALPSTARAAPSFDCLDATAPVESVICSDPVLADQDARLAEVFKQRRAEAAKSKSAQLLTDQRAWLKDRLQTCGIRQSGDEPTHDEQWRWAPCLVREYDKRLRALNAPPPPPEPAIRYAPMPKDGTFVHPMCLQEAVDAANPAMEAASPTVDLKACNAAHAHIRPTLDGEARHQISAGGLADGFPTWVSMIPVSTTSDGYHLVIYAENGGGTGIFTDLVRYRIDATGRLSARQAGLGGDRCNGGIQDARTQGTGVEIDRAITSSDLGALIGVDESLSNDMDLCAICCLGAERMIVTWPIKADPEIQTEAILIDPSILSADIGADSGASAAQRCLSRTVLDVIAHPTAAVPVTQAADRLSDDNQPMTSITLAGLRTLKSRIERCVAAAGTTDQLKTP